MSDAKSTPLRRPEATGAQVPPIVAAALGFGIVAAGFALAMFSVRSGGWWWVIAACCGVATIAGLTSGAWKDRRTTLVENWPWALGVTVVYLVTAIAATVAGSRRHLLWEVLAGAVLGAAIGSGGLLVLQDLIKGQTERAGPNATSPERQQTMIGSHLEAIWAAVALGAALVLLIWGMSIGGQLLAAEGILVFTVAVIYLVVAADVESERKPVWALLIGTVLIVQAIVFVVSGEGLDLSTGLGIGCWLIGLTMVKLGFGPELKRHNHDLDFSRSRTISLLVLVATVGGFLALWWGASKSNQLAVLAALSTVVVGLSFLGLCVTRVGLEQHKNGKQYGWRILGAGVLLGLVGYWWAERAILVAPLAVLASLVVASIGAWFVLRGEGLVAIMLIGFVIIWGLADRTTESSPDPNPAATARILALGDSFISGEGAPDYFEGTNNVGADRNECRRAPTAYPYLLAEDLEMGLDFFACAGAKTTDIMSEPQMPDSPDEIPGAEAQLAYVERLTDPQKESIKVVLVSIGGNDVGFSTIIRACLLPKDCNELERTWNANVDQLTPELTKTYQAIAEAIPTAQIVVVPYPHVLDTRKTCGLGLRSAEHQFVVNFVNRLNGQIHLAAAEAGVTVFTANQNSFADHLLCDPEPATNHLRLSATSGDWLGRYSPDKWIHGSMHPEPLGHRLIADRLAPFLCHGVLDEQVVTKCSKEPDPVVEQPEGTVGVDSLAAGEQSLADNAQEQLEDGKWIHDQLYATVASMLPPTVLLLLGGMLFAAGLVISNRIPDALHPDQEQGSQSQAEVGSD